MNLNDTLPLGTVNLPLWLAAVVLAALVLKITLKRLLPEGARLWEDRVWTAVLGGFAVWKLGPLVSSWPTVSKEPLALLYLPGDGWALGLGVAAGLLWLGVNLWRDRGQAGPVLPALGLGLGASLASVLVLAAGLSLVPAGRPAAQAPTAVQEADLVLATLDGGTQTLGRAPGKVLFVNFWATWCPPCRAEIPEFAAFWAQADQSKVAIQAVDLMTSEQDPSQVPAFVRSQGMVFPILIDDRGEAATRHRIESIPTTLVYDPRGTLVLRHTGVMTRAMLESLVRQYGP